MSTMVETVAQLSAFPEIPPGTGITPEGLLKLPDGKHYELIDGELVERNMSALSSYVAARAVRFLGNFCDDRNLGWVLDSEIGYQCFSWKPSRVRRADVSFIRLERYPLEQLSEEGHVSIPPDLAVEVISPNDFAEKLIEKLEDYLRAGVKLIWVLNPSTRTLQVYRSEGSSVWLRENDEVTGENIIPGFRCAVRVFFPAEAEAVAAADLKS
jgi:Uma2 family endonuclease